MSIKISFYASIKNEREPIYQIDAGEICSEFIARYFQKLEERYIQSPNKSNAK